MSKKIKMVGGMKKAQKASRATFAVARLLANVGSDPVVLKSELPLRDLRLNSQASAPGQLRLDSHHRRPSQPGDSDDPSHIPLRRLLEELTSYALPEKYIRLYPYQSTPSTRPSYTYSHLPR